MPTLRSWTPSGPPRDRRLPTYILTSLFFAGRSIFDFGKEKEEKEKSWGRRKDQFEAYSETAGHFRTLTLTLLDCENTTFLHRHFTFCNLLQHTKKTIPKKWIPSENDQELGTPKKNAQICKAPSAADQAQNLHIYCRPTQASSQFSLATGKVRMLRSPTTAAAHRSDRHLSLPSSSSLPYSFGLGPVAGDFNCLSTTTTMSSFGQERHRQHPEDDESLPAGSAAAFAPHGDEMLHSPRRRALDSFEPLMSMASFDDHHLGLPAFADNDESHHTHKTHHARPKHDEEYDNANVDDDEDAAAEAVAELAVQISREAAAATNNNNDGPGDEDNTLSTDFPMSMADPDDESNGFSSTMCFVRRQLEFFLATHAEADERRKKGGVSGNVRAGSLGFRCIHCKHLPSAERAPSAEAYPNQVQLIYQAVRNFQRHHFLKCPSIPQRLKDQYQSMPRRRKSKRPAHKHADPWVYSANRKGLSDMVDDTSRGGYRITCSPPPPASVTPIPPTPIQVKEPKRKKSRRS